jgi:type IV pilus assembly protein PilP
MSPARSLLPTLGALVISGGIAGCAPEQDDLEAYIAKVQSRKSTDVEPVPQVLVYEPFRYAQYDEPDPFQAFESGAAGPIQTQSSSALSPDFNRNREPLESFPLEGLRMRGTLEFRGQRYALIQAPDGIVHRVQTGNYMGQNYGRVVEIGAAEIVLEEIVPDGLGGYVKRDATVALRGDEA